MAKENLIMPNECTPLAGEVLAIEKEIKDLQAELHGTYDPKEKPPGPDQKRFITSQIKKLTNELAKAQQQLSECLGIPEPALPCAVVFTGTATLTTADARFPGPFTNQISPTATFGSARTFLRIDSFSPITATFTVPVFGSNTTTVSVELPAGGPFDPNTGHLVLSLPLKFEHSIVLAGNSTASITLRTDMGSGQALFRGDGSVTLVGASTFVGGFLNGTGFSLLLTGTMSPICW
jgi:hypothetical protein